MVLLTLTSYFFPENISSSHLNDNLNEAYASSDIKQIVVTPSPCRGISEDLRKEYKKKEHKHEFYLDGMMEVYRFSMYKEGTNTLLRAFRYVLTCCKQLYYGLRIPKVDALFLASTPPIQGAIGAIIRKCRKTTFVYNLQDIFPDSLVGTGLTKKGSLFWKIGRVIENFTYKHADKIIVISEDFKKNIMAKGVPDEKIVVVYNWVDQNAIKPVEDNDNPLYEEFAISKDTFRVVYAGNLGNAQNLDIVIEAAEKLKDNDKIEFFIFGKGGLEDDIRASIEKKGLKNVHLLPLQPYERVSYVYGLGNLCLVSCKAGLGGSAFPSKTWSILSAGRPVIASFDEGELKHIIESNDMGVFTKAMDVDNFVQTILELSFNPTRCKEMGENGRKFILNNLTKEVGVAKYIDIIKEVVGK